MPTIDTTTGSEILQFADGLIEVYGGENGVLLTIRREPRDIYRVRSVEMTGEQARVIGQALLDAANAAKASSSAS